MCNGCRFVVEVDEDIKDMIFIVEYMGEVDYMCCCYYDFGNSIMGFFFSDDFIKEFVICLDKCSNIVWFFLGINNYIE